MTSSHLRITTLASLSQTGPPFETAETSATTRNFKRPRRGGPRGGVRLLQEKRAIATKDHGGADVLAAIPPPAKRLFFHLQIRRDISWRPVCRIVTGATALDAENSPCSNDNYGFIV